MFSHVKTVIFYTSTCENISFWIAAAFSNYLLHTTSEFQMPTTFLFVNENIKCVYSFSY